MIKKYFKIINFFFLMMLFLNINNTVNAENNEKFSEDTYIISAEPDKWNVDDDFIIKISQYLRNNSVDISSRFTFQNIYEVEVLDIRDSEYYVSVVEVDKNGSFLINVNGIIDISTKEQVTPFFSTDGQNGSSSFYFVKDDEIFRIDKFNADKIKNNQNVDDMYKYDLSNEYLAYYSYDNLGNVKRVYIDKAILGMNNDGYGTYYISTIKKSENAKQYDGKYLIGLLKDDYAESFDYATIEVYPYDITIKFNDGFVVGDKYSNFNKDTNYINKYGIMRNDGVWTYEPQNNNLTECGYGRFRIVENNKAYIVDYSGKNLGFTDLEVSNWAKNYVEQAKQLKLQCMHSTNGTAKQSSWNITRLQFCYMAVELYKINKREHLVFEENSDSENKFSDISSNEVDIAVRLGIIKGRGNNIFDPYSSITREEAAIMLSRLAKILDLEINDDDNIEFNDIDNLTIEGQNAIKDISAIGIESNRIMNGVGNNMFAPNDYYTIEQADTTFVRLYNALDN